MHYTYGVFFMKRVYKAESIQNFWQCYAIRKTKAIYLVVGSHLLASLERIKVPLASSDIIVASLEALGESLCISFT